MYITHNYNFSINSNINYAFSYMSNQHRNRNHQTNIWTWKFFFFYICPAILQFLLSLSRKCFIKKSKWVPCLIQSTLIIQFSEPMRSGAWCWCWKYSQSAFLLESRESRIRWVRFQLFSDNFFTCDCNKLYNRIKGRKKFNESLLRERNDNDF